MAKQTAVQWLVMTYNQRQGYIRFEDIDKAKEMEAEQTLQSYIEGAEEAKKILKEELNKFIVLPKSFNDENNK